MLTHILAILYLINTMYTIYTTSTSIEYVHWHKDGNHGMDIESNMDLKYLLKQKKKEDERIKKNIKESNYYHPYKKKLPSRSITDLVIDKLKKDTKNYEKQKSIIDKTAPNINHLQHHHYGTSLIITHDKYTSIINGKKKTDEDGIIEAKEYDDDDDDDDVQDLKFDKHPYGLFSFPFTIFDKLGFGGWF